MLKKGYASKTVSKNIKTEMKSGKKPEVAIAIAMDIAHKAKMKAGKPMSKADMKAMKGKK